MVAFSIGGDWTWAGNTTFNGLIHSPGLGNSITGFTVYFDPISSLFTYGAAPGGGGAFDPSFNYTITATLWTINGAFQFNAGFDINSPNEISIVSTGAGNPINIEATNDQLTLTSDGRALLQSLSNNVFIQALAAGQQVEIFADGFNFSSQQTANFNSVNAGVNINANNGSLNLGSLTASFFATNSMSIGVTAGGMNINTASGDLNFNSGVGSTSGNINFTAALGNINVSATGTGATCGFNIDSNIFISSINGQVGINSATANISAGPGGISLGVSAGSGMNVNDVTGDFQFGASTGSFLIGALANTVDIVSGTIMTLSASTQLDLEAANITLSLITSQAPVVAAPTISLPAGFAHVIMNTTTKQIFYMS